MSHECTSEPLLHNISLIPVYLQNTANIIYSGLGEVICRKFAAAGANVAINYMSSEDRAAKLASEIKKEHDVKVIIIKGVCPVFSCASYHTFQILHVYTT